MNPTIFRANNPTPEKLVGNDLRERIKHELFRTHGHEVKESLTEKLKRMMRGEVSPQELRRALGDRL